MAQIKIQADASFQVLSHSFSVSPSNVPYSLEYSADGLNWSSYEDEIPQDEVLICEGCAYGQYIHLAGYEPWDDEGTLIY